MSTRPPTWRQLLEAATDKGSSQQPLFSDSQPAPSCASQQPLASWAPEQRSGAPKKPPSPPALSLTQPQDTSRTTDAGPTVDQFLTQPIPRDAMPAESPSQGNPAAACSQIQQEASQHPRLPETQCTQSVFDTQATQAVPSMPDLASDLGVQEGPGLLPISLEHYGTLYTELVGKDGAGRVKACYGLEENKFSKVDLKQASIDSRQASMFSWLYSSSMSSQLWSPFQDASCKVLGGHVRSVVQGMTWLANLTLACESDMLAGPFSSRAWRWIKEQEGAKLPYQPLFPRRLSSISSLSQRGSLLNFSDRASLSALHTYDWLVGCSSGHLGDDGGHEPLLPIPVFHTSSDTRQLHWHIDGRVRVPPCRFGMERGANHFCGAHQAACLGHHPASCEAGRQP